MLIVKVELHSAITGDVTEIARMMICNDGTGSGKYGNYIGTVYRGRSKEHFDKKTVMRVKNIFNWPRLDFHVWNLVSKMLNEMGYTKGR